jgi:hypothetical protein
MWWSCPSNGPEGCRCKGSPNHSGDHGHDGICRWTDEEAISRMAADAMLIRDVGPVRAIAMLAERDLMEFTLALLGPDGEPRPDER